MNSLRQRLLLLLLGAMSLVLIVVVFFDHRSARQELDSLFDAQMAESAHVLLGIAQRTLTERIEHGIEDESPVTHEYEQTMVYQVWNHQTLILRSATAPATLMGASTQPGYSTITINTHRWRLLVLWDSAHELMIQMAEPMRGRERLARQIVLNMLFPSVAIAIPLVPLMIWVMVNTGLRPLRQLRREVVQRSADRLEPLDLLSIPFEVKPLATALNDLFGRLRHSIESERRFTADAAHELRTPLAALRTQAQVALRSVMEEDRHHALHQVQQGIERSTHLIEQLLTLARIDPEEAGTRHDLVLIYPLAAESLAFLAGQAELKKIELLLKGETALRILGQSGHLSILLRNLVDNAIRYSPPRSTVVLQLSQTASHEVQLDITDNGPGIPAEEMQRVMERFYRLPGSGQQGSGLGLSIVQRIAEHHRARLSLAAASSQGGLRVTVIFPSLPLLHPPSSSPSPPSTAAMVERENPRLVR
ncbi:sensor histidine kinase [Ferrovum myxofaciens]|jgi:two-component system sensor histidine kinase QseC|uniref:histidine kinase n=1 Tax=Ferrovum myxofaciens TaxID=416213 RepID=A0A9E6MUB5_9PROT|nr:sensor histidine kinase [Ferrovum myxofaciens]MBU6994494.1 sensor histidine kinase N-terminal domain-containing protein [Ferrovum myxofaciens]QKE38366.1 MAG: sensor histidine kinase N-terminal domain-containing protein [Ferrovum myxofaciens]QWY76103.1 MAG: sensor histidine kinase N-terminal domain-containing protein [Ferrovum myxofaciens]QWY76300.1 MAG: sensor histidine kinase N-terminal domain-containing protein [Ferrovum myxofaciens]